MQSERALQLSRLEITIAKSIEVALRLENFASFVRVRDSSCISCIAQSSRCKRSAARVEKIQVCVLQCEDGPRQTSLMLRVKVGPHPDDVHTVKLGKEFPMTSGMQKKTTEKDIVVGLVRVLSGHDEIDGIDIITELGSVAKDMMTSTAGECDFVETFRKEDLSSIDLRQ